MLSQQHIFATRKYDPLCAFVISHVPECLALGNRSASPPWLRALWFGKPPRSEDGHLDDSVEPGPADDVQRWRHLCARLLRSHLPFLAILRLRATQLLKKGEIQETRARGFTKAHMHGTPNKFGPTLRRCIVDVLSVKEELSRVLADVGVDLAAAKLEAEIEQGIVAAEEEGGREMYVLETMRSRFNVCSAAMEELGLHLQDKSFSAFQQKFQDVVSELLQRATVQTETLNVLRQAHGGARGANKRDIDVNNCLIAAARKCW